MILFAIVQFLIWLLALLFLVFPKVEVLPFGIDVVMVEFVQQVHGLIVVMPFMEIVWQGIGLVLGIELMLFTMGWFLWLIERVK